MVEKRDKSGDAEIVDAGEDEQSTDVKMSGGQDEASAGMEPESADNETDEDAVGEDELASADMDQSDGDESGWNRGLDNRISAVIRVGGRQYRVQPGQFVLFDQSKEFATKTETVVVTDVLSGIGENSVLGSPKIDGAEVHLLPLWNYRGKKTISFKKRRRKHGSQRRIGHRRPFVCAKVESINIPGLVARPAISAE